MREVEELALEVEELNAALKLALAERDEWHRQNGLLRGELEAARRRVAELEATHARCADYYVGGPGPSVVEVSAPFDEDGG